MPEVHGEMHLARHDIGRVRLDFERAHGADGERRVRAGNRIDLVDQAGGADERVFAQVHRGGARMGVLADHARLVPAHALHAGDDADVLGFGLQDRALLDVQLEKRRERMRPASFWAPVADRLERRAERFAGTVPARHRPGAIERPREHARGSHGRREPRALLVGPVHHLDRRERLVAGLDEGAQRLERGEHAQHAVEFPPRRLGVEMAAERDRRHVGLPRPPREHRAHVIDGDGAAELLRARLEPVAHLTVEIAQREPADAAFRRAADRGGLHQLAPQPLAVDFQILHACKPLRSSPLPRGERSRAKRAGEGDRIPQISLSPHPIPLPGPSRMFPTWTDHKLPNPGTPEFGGERESRAARLGIPNTEAANCG